MSFRKGGKNILKGEKNPESKISPPGKSILGCSSWGEIEPSIYIFPGGNFIQGGKFPATPDLPDIQPCKTNLSNLKTTETH